MRSGAIHTKLITDVGDADCDAGSLHNDRIVMPAACITTANEPV
jgi:hypothetical protein